MTIREISEKWEEICRIEVELEEADLSFYGSVPIRHAHDYGYIGHRKDDADGAWLRRTGKMPPENWVRLCGLIKELTDVIGSRAVILPGGEGILRLDDEDGTLMEDEVYQEPVDHKVIP